MKDFLLGCVVLLVAFVLLTVLASAFAYPFAWFGCHNRWADSGMPYRYDVLGGCKVFVKGGWIPEDRLRAVE